MQIFVEFRDHFAYQHGLVKLEPREKIRLKGYVSGAWCVPGLLLLKSCPSGFICQLELLYFSFPTVRIHKVANKRFKLKLV